MKKQIEEVQRYFIDKITACKFDECKIENHVDWDYLYVIIDGYSFSFGINKTKSLYCFFSGFIKINIPNDRLKNLVTMINNESEKIKSKKIEKLKKELEQLQNH